MIRGQGLGAPEIQAGVGGLGKDHRELGPEEVLSLPLQTVWAGCHLPAPLPPGHSRRGMGLWAWDWASCRGMW